VRRFVERYRPKKGAEVDRRHRQAYDAGQLDYADLPDWPGKEIVVRPRIIRIAPLSGKDVGEVWMARHAGRELLIPLFGAFKYLYVNVTTDDLDELDERKYRELVSPDRREGEVNETALNGMTDILTFNSKYHHGFYAIGDEAYVLHLRILVDLDAAQLGDGRLVSAQNTRVLAKVKGGRR
jgi:hypothetical protein